MLVLFCIGTLLLDPVRGTTKTISASSCSLADVQTAINTAVDGDTVRVPPGTCSWTTGISFQKGIHLRGVSPGAVSFIHDAGTDYLLEVIEDDTHVTEISNLRFIEGTGTADGHLAVYSAPGRPVLLHNNYFETNGGATSGSVSVSPIVNTTYTVDCDGATDSATVTVTPAVPGNSHKLQLGITGKGGGTVTSSAQGISCPDDCEQSFGSGTTVTLTAVPDDKSTFKQWQGDCTGTEPVCTMVMDGAKNTTAVFYYFPWIMFIPTIESGNSQL